ncbi:MAG: zinc ABC transporter substrate-binding protein [Candidatus Moraniibacteriota bacterium]|nr:MAG: zinc ABC transporter substrate-binding protein [Candidatus Moranbacteria bacterium]
MKRKILILIGAVLTLLFVGVVVFFLSRGNESTSLSLPGNSKKLSVVTTLFPLAEFAREVGGDFVDVKLLLPPGAEAHAFEPTPQDIAMINSADLFIFTGKAMEPWAENIASEAQKSGVRVLDASVGVPMLLRREDRKEDSGDTDSHDSEEANGRVDPHIWLDPENAIHMVQEIEKALSEKDAEHKDVYRERSEAYQETISLIDEAYRTTLESCATKTLLYGGHYAFGYVAKRYGLSYRAAQGFSPDAEPTARTLAELTDQIRRENIRFIFYEELSSPKIAETLSRETGATLLLLNAAHNVSKEDMGEKVSFLDILEENRANLAEGLECRE